MHITRILGVGLMIVAPSLASAGPTAPVPTASAPAKAPAGKSGVPDDGVKPIGKSGVADDGVKTDPKVVRARLVKLIARTHALVVRAHKAVVKGELGRADYRKARVGYAAALIAFEANKPALSAKLALEVRPHARKVLELNKQKIAEQEANTDAEELATAEGFSDKELASGLKAADKTTPAVEEITKSEPAAPPAPAPEPAKPASSAK